MDWLQVITLGIALIGAVLGVVNTVVNYRRGSIRLRIEHSVTRGQDNTLSLNVKVVNHGRVPVSIEDVYLADYDLAKKIALRDRDGYPTFPLPLPGNDSFIFTVPSYAFKTVIVIQPLILVAQTKDGLRVESRCGALSKLYMELQPKEPAGNSPLI